MMRVGVNLLWLVPGNVGGSEEYLTRQLAALHEHRPDIELTLFVVQGFRDRHPDLAGAVRTVEAPIDGLSRPRRVAAESGWLARAVRESGVSFMHHGGGTLPLRLVVPAVLTIHDLQYFTFPETFSKVKLRWLQRSVPRAVARAAVIATPSRFVADDVIGRFGVAPSRVVVVPNASPSLSESLCQESLSQESLSQESLSQESSPVSESELRDRFDLPGRFILYPAIRYHHKNHVTLVRAFARLHVDDPTLRLVLLGGAGPADADVSAAVTELRLGAAVLRPGRVPDSDRDGLYRHASVLAFPSRYEGFGVPVLEAFVHGVPVVAARAAALPEAVGDAGLLVDPLDVDGWVDALRSILDDSALADHLRDAGRRRALEFSPAVSATALADAYGRVSL
jgi:glycosyltransferase involved in cell wall biosynthesis